MKKKIMFAAIVAMAMVAAAGCCVCDVPSDAAIAEALSTKPLPIPSM